MLAPVATPMIVLHPLCCHVRICGLLVTSAVSRVGLDLRVKLFEIPIMNSLATLLHSVLSKVSDHFSVFESHELFLLIVHRFIVHVVHLINDFNLLVLLIHTRYHFVLIALSSSFFQALIRQYLRRKKLFLFEFIVTISYNATLLQLHLKMLDGHLCLTQFFLDSLVLVN